MITSILILAWACETVAASIKMQEKIRTFFIIFQIVEESDFVFDGIRDITFNPYEKLIRMFKGFVINWLRGAAGI